MPSWDWGEDSLHPIACLALRRTCPSTLRLRIDCFSTAAAVTSTACTLVFLLLVVCPLQDFLDCFALGLNVVSEHRYSPFDCLGCCSFEQVGICKSHFCCFSSAVFVLYLLQDWWWKPLSSNFKHLERGVVLTPGDWQILTILDSSYSSFCTQRGQRFEALDHSFLLSTLTFPGCLIWFYSKTTL